LRTSNFKNTLLKALGGDILERLRLQPVKFGLKHEIENPGDLIDHLYFLEEGMASMTTSFKDGSQVEVGMFGYESVIGVSALMGTKKSLNRIYTQIAGHGYTCQVETRDESSALAATFSSWRCAMFRHNSFRQCNPRDAMRNTTSSSGSPAGCSSVRTARTSTLSRFRMSFLADMLGGRRPTISTAAGILKQKGLIEYTAEKFASSTSLGSPRPLASAIYHQRLSGQLRKVRHRNHYVEASPTAARRTPFGLPQYRRAPRSQKRDLVHPQRAKD